MKHFNSIKMIFFLCLAIMLGGCKPDLLTITTKVKPDGSLLRTVAFSFLGDSTGVPEMAYPLPRDSSWAMTCEPDSDGQVFSYTLSKSFSSVEELNKELGCRRDTIKVNDEVAFKKRFRWFFTYYRFEETLYSVNPFTLVPIENYLTPEELRFFYAQKDTMDIDDKAEAWQMRSVFESYYQVLKTAVGKQNTPLTTEQLELRKEDLFKSFSEGGEFLDPFSEALLSRADSLFTTSPSLFTLKEHFAEVDTTWNRYVRFAMQGNEEYEFVVEMPGRIIDADSAGSIEQNKVTWKVNTESFEYRDVAMRVESRRLNKVPTVIFGLFILSLITLLWIAAARARHRRWIERGLSPAEFPRLLLKPWISALCMMVGAGLAGYFSVLYVAFFAHPTCFFLPLLSSSDRILFLTLAAIGAILFIFGLVHLIRWIRRKKE